MTKIVPATSTHDDTATTLPPTMAAVVQRGYGGIEVLHQERIPTPAPSAGQVLVRVEAAGVDRGVWHIMAGLPYVVRPMFGIRSPRQPIPGSDFAGTVVALGPDASEFAVGERVFGFARGSYAQYAVADVSAIAAMPASLSFDDAAALPVSASTALEAVRTHGEVRAGQRVLVTGASGGVGGYAVQIAVADGADVTGVASAAKADLVRALGASRSIDYATTDVTDLPDRYDVIIDVNGRLPVRRLARILTPTGTLVIVGGENGGRLTGGLHRQFGATLRSVFSRRKLGFFISSESGEGLGTLADLIESGAIRATTGTVRPLDEAGTTIDDLVAGRLRGKAVLHPTD